MEHLKRWVLKTLEKIKPSALTQMKLVKKHLEQSVVEDKLDDEVVKPEGPTESFKKYCEENPSALECRIYDN